MKLHIAHKPVWPDDGFLRVQPPYENARGSVLRERSGKDYFEIKEIYLLFTEPSINSNHRSLEGTERAMGNCGQKSLGTRAERDRNKKINGDLKQQKREVETIIRILLLGAGESGKSTFAKQMRILYLEGFDETECQRFKGIIHNNVIVSLQALISACNQFGLTLEEQNRHKTPEELEELEVNSSSCAYIKGVWQDPAIQTAFSRQNEFQLYDSTQYYLDDIERICDEQYKPTEQDILRSRSKTIGITETNFEVENVRFVMVDVGGQRSERRKWIHCFEDITAVIYCVAMSEYDLKLYEDETVSRIEESLMLFDEICNSEWFEKTSIILFLNKVDIFKEKIMKHDLSICFPKYKGGPNFEKSSAFIKKTFESRNKTTKSVFTHMTCATDTENVRFVFNAVRGHILSTVMVGVI
ncbi:guanine nucleotide-binding protein alpha-1 subunit [Planoprotostelium fungivorum]|uniref:Guanine nucleotide-binding protein alpha-1 subunit n=1 Tax=Planoprotostelium fungivorum TaxID=1890364 RepID=A0A2P6NQY9_9EUKA|nr:guanine nucleotide-binding protein alpha-1 subunit [Planoprotostelium fungivorum]